MHFPFNLKHLQLNNARNMIIKIFTILFFGFIVTKYNTFIYNKCFLFCVCRTRGSLLQFASSRCSETSSSCSINSSILQSPTDVITTHCQFPASYTYSARFSDWNDDCNASLTVGMIYYNMITIFFLSH